MKIVIKHNGDDSNIVYLRTDDGVNVSAKYADNNQLIYAFEEIIKESGDETIDVSHEYNKEDKDMNDNLPLVLVFYLDRELMSSPQIIRPFADSVNDAIAERNANAMAFFLPTDGAERIECLNPKLATPEEKSRISTMITEIEKSFDIGQGADEDYDDINIINNNDLEDEN